jgi:hypothetical protein
MGNTITQRNYKLSQESFNKNSSEYPKYLRDFEKSPLWEPFHSTYRGINYTIKRPMATHLCGYVHAGHIDLTEDEMDEIEDDSCHHDFTAGFGGFDCAHHTDYVPSQLPSFFDDATYKDFDYVESIIENIIDHIYRLRPNLSA